MDGNFSDCSGDQDGVLHVQGHHLEVQIDQPVDEAPQNPQSFELHGNEHLWITEFRISEENTPTPTSNKKNFFPLSEE